MKKLIMLLTLLTATVSAMGQTALRQRGYKGFAEVGLSASFCDGERTGSLALTTSHGYQCTPNFFFGVGTGVGVEGSSAYDEANVSVPVFGQARFNFTSRPISPYLDLKGGYLFQTDSDYSGGVISPTLGVSLPFCQRCAVNFGISYTCRFIPEQTGWPYYDDRYTLHNLAISFGFEF